MAGEGFAMHAIKSLKENRRQLQKRGLFKKKRTFLNLEDGEFKRSTGSIISKKLSKEELQKYKEKTIKSRTKEVLYSRIVICVFAALFITFSSIYLINSIKGNRFNMGYITRNVFEKKLVKYNRLISSGDESLKEKRYFSAIYDYRLALEVFPEDSLATFRLITVCDLNCEINLNNCGESEKLLEDFVLNN